MRVDRGFAFLDLEGFTALTQAQGDERAVEVLTAYRATLRELASRDGVRIAKWLGDGCMLVGTDVPQLVRMVEEAVERLEAELPLHVRAGIAAGPVILFEGDDHIGSPVNLAAKLCDIAGAGMVLVGPGVVEHLPQEVLHPVAAPIPGFPIPIPAARLVRPARA